MPIMANAIDQILTLVLKKKDGSAIESLIKAFGLRETTILSDGKAVEGLARAGLENKEIHETLKGAHPEVDYCLQ